jgi:hypothetical protein
MRSEFQNYDICFPEILCYLLSSVLRALAVSSLCVLRRYLKETVTTTTTPPQENIIIFILHMLYKALVTH